MPTARRTPFPSAPCSGPRPMEDNAKLPDLTIWTPVSQCCPFPFTKPCGQQDFLCVRLFVCLLLTSFRSLVDHSRSGLQGMWKRESSPVLQRRKFRFKVACDLAKVRNWLWAEPQLQCLERRHPDLPVGWASCSPLLALEAAHHSWLSLLLHHETFRKKLFISSTAT